MEYRKDTRRYLDVFEELLVLCKTDGNLLRSIHNSIYGTRVYKGIREKVLSGESVCTYAYRRESGPELLKEQMRQEAHGKIGIINFSHALCPGGGVVRGAGGAEAELCRNSTLYWCLNTEALQKAYYRPHRRMEAPLYDDTCIYNPDVIFFPGSREQRCLVDVISCALPDFRAGVYMDCIFPEEVWSRCLCDRLRSVLHVAQRQGIESLVIVGVEQALDMLTVAEVDIQIKKALRPFRHVFRHVSISLQDNGAQGEYREMNLL